jgi:hypothetical protein
LLIKVAERRATLLGLNPVLGHAVKIVQHEPVNKPTSTDKIEAALNALRERLYDFENLYRQRNIAIRELIAIRAVLGPPL